MLSKFLKSIITRYYTAKNVIELPYTPWRCIANCILRWVKPSQISIIKQNATCCSGYDRFSCLPPFIKLQPLLVPFAASYDGLPFSQRLRIEQLTNRSRLHDQLGNRGVPKRMIVRLQESYLYLAVNLACKGRYPQYVNFESNYAKCSLWQKVSVSM